MLEKKLALTSAEKKPRPNPDELQTLSRVSQLYSCGSITNVVNTTLTERRIARLEKKAFQVSELIGPLAKASPVYVADEAAIRSWYQSTVPACAGADDGAAPGGGKDAKKDGGKKKK